jgi:hypothetical protein
VLFSLWQWAVLQLLDEWTLIVSEFAGTNLPYWQLWLMIDTAHYHAPAR